MACVLKGKSTSKNRFLIEFETSIMLCTNIEHTREYGQEEGSQSLSCKINLP